MKYYKDQQNKVHALDDVSYEYLLPGGCVPITDEEAELLNPKPVQQNPILAEIISLEAEITERRKREAILLVDGAMEWLKTQDEKIASLRALLTSGGNDA